MLEFHCDKCGRPVDRDAAAQVRIVFFAYSAGEEKVPIYRELCTDCALDLDAILCPGEEGQEREALKESWGWKDAFEPAVTDREEPTMEVTKTRTAAPTVPKACTTETKNPYGEGRCITIARIRAEMKQWELGEKTIAEQASVSQWERGKVKPDWKLLEQILPELAEIRKKGCAAYCGHASVCINRGECYYARYRVCGEEEHRG